MSRVAARSWLVAGPPLAIRLLVTGDASMSIASLLAVTLAAVVGAELRPRWRLAAVAVGAVFVARLWPLPGGWWAALTATSLGAAMWYLESVGPHAERPVPHPPSDAVRAADARTPPFVLLGAGAVAVASAAPWMASIALAAAAVGAARPRSQKAIRTLLARSRTANTAVEIDATPADQAVTADGPGERGVGEPSWIPGWIGIGTRLPVAAWLVVAVVVNLVQEVVHDVTQQGMSLLQAVLPPYSVFGGRVAWDSTNFVTIATEGYLKDHALEASFPGYPLLIRGLVAVSGLDVFTAAVLISAVGGLAATILFWKWTDLVGVTLRNRLIALALFLVAPPSFVLFGVAYADSVMLAFTMAALVAVATRRDLLAGIAAACATLTRPTALALVPALIIAVLERDGVISFLRRGPATGAAIGAGRAAHLAGRIGFDRRRLRPAQAGVLLSLAGIGAYAVWSWRARDDPFYFWTIQTEHYGHRPMTSLFTWTKVEFLRQPGEFVHNRFDAVNQVGATLLAGLALLLAPRIGRRLGWGMSTLVLAAVTILWVTAMWFAPARYLLVAIAPLTVVAAEAIGRRPRTLWPTLVVSASSMVLLAGAFAAVVRLNW